MYIIEVVKGSFSWLMYMYIVEDVIKMKIFLRLFVIYEFYGVVKRFYINYG